MKLSLISILEKYTGPKKYVKKTADGKTVRYGAKGYKIAPGTSKGDSYCARSFGQMKKHPEAAKDPNSPLRLSRKKWRCSGERSLKETHVIDNGISADELKQLCVSMNINLSQEPFLFEDLLKGANHEIEHKNVVNSSPSKIVKIAMDHLREDPDYYTKLAEIE